MAKKKQQPEALTDDASHQVNSQQRRSVEEPILADSWKAALAKRFETADPELYKQTIQFFTEIKEQNKQLWMENYELKEKADRWKKLCLEYGEGADKAKGEVKYYQEKYEGGE